MSALAPFALVAVAALAARRGAFASEAPELRADVKRALAALVGALAAVGMRVKVGSAGRSEAAQVRAFDEGRSSTRAGKHVQGLAVDVYPIDPATGLPDWNGRNLDLFRTMHRIAAGLGWRGLAFNADGSPRYLVNRFGRRYWDGAHLEWSGVAS